ncbi:MAG: hypothetical protein AAFV07_00325 [Bacteroidota bacterium]
MQDRISPRFWMLVSFVWILLLPLASQAQTTAPRLYITATDQKPDYVEIKYEITLAGFVELHLFSPNGKKLWIKGRVTDRKGVDYIRIPKKPLKAGDRYTFVLKYKGKDYSSSFYAS